MRFIDADLLKIRISNAIIDDEYIQDIIDEMPTVNERQLGEWIKTYILGVFVCSNCKMKVTYVMSIIVKIAVQI